MLFTSRRVTTLTQELQGHAAAVSADVPSNTCDGENTFCAASDTEEQELQVLNVTCFTRTKVVVPLQHLFTCTRVQILALAELQGHVLVALGKPFFF
jgi:hypothetical protein